MTTENVILYLSATAAMRYTYGYGQLTPRFCSLLASQCWVHFKGVLGVRSYFVYIYIFFFYVLMCVYVSRTRFPSSRAIKDVYLEIYLFLYHVFMPLNLFHFALRRFFSGLFGGDDPYFPVPLYYIKI